jgi:hypothetical protein
LRNVRIGKPFLKSKEFQNSKNTLVSSEQELCGKDFKIRSSWSFNLPNVTIGVKYFPSSVDKGSKFNLKYEQMTITLDNNKIVGIIYEI